MKTIAPITINNQTGAKKGEKWMMKQVRDIKAFFYSSPKVYSLSHRIFGHIHGLLNID